MKYTFNTLSPSEFESLVTDLLNKYESDKGSGIIYTTYKSGADQGIDFRYSSSDNSNYIIGQVKAYYESGYSALKSTIKGTKNKKGELDKVKILKPNRYIFATSCKLSPERETEIKSLFAPFIKSENDVYGNEKINRLIVKYDSIHKQYYKLYLSSIETIHSLLEFKHFKINEINVNSLIESIRVFKITDFFRSLEVDFLNKDLLLIAGAPGIGKTTIAEQLAYSYLLKEYEIIIVGTDLNSSLSQLKTDDSKQLFLFDDFLGANSKEYDRQVAYESEIYKFIRNVVKYTNKKIIVTTRHYILGRAKIELEKIEKIINRFGVVMIKGNCYTPEEREGIVENVIVSNFKDLLGQEEVLKQLSDNQHLLYDMVDEKYFNPRVLNYACDNGKFDLESISYQVRDPSEVWKKAYNYTLTVNQKAFIRVLFSFVKITRIDILASAYFAYLKYCKDNLIINDLTNETFDEITDKLDGSLITIKNINDLTFIEINEPSLKDYLYDENSKNESILISMLNGVYCYDQLINFGPFTSSTPSLVCNWPTFSVTSYFLERLKTNDIKSIRIGKYFSSDEIKNILRYCTIITYVGGEYFDKSDYDVKLINVNAFAEFRSSELYSILLCFILSDKIIIYLREKELALFKICANNVLDYNYLDDLAHVWKKIFKEDKISRVIKIEIQERYITKFENIIRDHIDSEMDDLKTEITSIEDFEDLKNQIEDFVVEIEKIFDVDLNSNLHEYEMEDWDEYILLNEMDRKMNNSSYD